MRDLTKFLSLFTDQSASARLLLKDQQMSHLDRVCRRAKAEAAIMRKLHGCENGEERKVIDHQDDSLREKIMQLPHIASAMELKFGAGGNNQVNAGVPGR